MNSVPCCIRTRLRNSRPESVVTYLAPSQGSLLLCLSTRLFFSSGGRAGRNPGDEVARQAFEREGGKSEYSSVRERNRRARCPASRCHPVYELNTLPACRRLHAGNSTLGLRLAVGQMVNWFIIYHTSPKYLVTFATAHLLSS